MKPGSYLSPSARLGLIALVLFAALFLPAAAQTTASNATNVYLPVIFGPAAPAPVQVEVNFLDVGQGDAILIRSSEGMTALIDGGERSPGVMGHLNARGVTAIDLMVATHPHSDHIGGLIEVLAALPVDTVVTNGQPHTTQTYEDFLDGIFNARADYVEAQRGDTVDFGSLAFEVLHPSRPFDSDLNENSLVLRLEVGEVTFLFTGDAESGAEAQMVSAGLPLEADILKVGHHGSSTSTSSEFLARVSPFVAVYMAGVGNSYGHPSEETIGRLMNAGVIVFGTDVNGTVTVTTDGKITKVTAEKGVP